MAIKHIVNCSGGKDSTATAILALDWMQKHDRMDDCTFVFADTMFEEDAVYDYVKYLQRRLNIEIRCVKTQYTQADFDRVVRYRKKHWPKKMRGYGHSEKTIRRRLAMQDKYMKPTGNAFVDMCMAKGGFPSPEHRYCTETLKIVPIHEHVVLPLLEAGNKVLHHLGVRRDESGNRAKTPFYKRGEGPHETPIPGLYVYYPIRDWTASDVFGFLRERGVARNRLYDEGDTRVGCRDCIFAKKGEHRRALIDRPYNIEFIRWMEKTVSRVAGPKTLVVALHGCKTAAHTKRWHTKRLPPTIDEIAYWASSGGQLDMFSEKIPGEIADIIKVEGDRCGKQGYC